MFFWDSPHNSELQQSSLARIRDRTAWWQESKSKNLLIQPRFLIWKFREWDSFKSNMIVHFHMAIKDCPQISNWTRKVNFNITRQTFTHCIYPLAQSVTSIYWLAFIWLKVDFSNTKSWVVDSYLKSLLRLKSTKSLNTKFTLLVLQLQWIYFCGTVHVSIREHVT